MDNGRDKGDDGLNGPFGPRQGMYKYDRILDKNLTQTVEYLEELCTKVCVCVGSFVTCSSFTCSSSFVTCSSSSVTCSFVTFI